MKLPESLKQLGLGAWYYGTLAYRQQQARRAARAGTAPVMVLFYHRIADRFSNAWTMSTGQFVRQIAWMERRYTFISLSEAQRRLQAGSNHEPAVCITFDDGYADNCRDALPLLIRKQIPVTYFVSTHQVFTGQPFPHDVAAGQPLAPNTLEQLRMLAAAGIEIGAHTRRHADLGQVTSGEVLVDEMVTSRIELENSLGIGIRYFAFPYGQRQNITAEAMRLAQQAGYAGVCSAYGGYNFPGDDVFHLQRIHGDTVDLRLKNWLTVDPRKTHIARPVFDPPQETKSVFRAAPDWPAVPVPEPETTVSSTS